MCYVMFQILNVLATRGSHAAVEVAAREATHSESCQPSPREVLECHTPGAQRAAPAETGVQER